MTIKGTLKHGLKVGNEVHKDYEMRAADAGDMFDAEDIAPVTKRLQYNAALTGIQLLKLGTLSGPIDIKVLRGLDPEDLDQLNEARDAADKEGNDSPST